MADGPGIATGAALEALSFDERRFPPPDEFRARANWNDPKVYEQAAADLEGFWAKHGEGFQWSRKWDRVLEWNAPYAKWFSGGKLNISENCLDRHVRAGLGAKVAFHWEGEPGETRTITYADLLAETQRCANALRELGVNAGDRVAIYMPMVPELPVAMLACARIGAPFTVVFGGFSAEALAGRIDDSGAKVVITADGGYRKGNIVQLKRNTDDAVVRSAGVEKVLVYKRTGHDVPWTEGRDVWWQDVVTKQKPECAPVQVDSEQMLYLL